MYIYRLYMKSELRLSQFTYELRCYIYKWEHIIIFTSTPHLHSLYTPTPLVHSYTPCTFHLRSYIHTIYTSSTSYLHARPTHIYSIPYCINTWCTTRKLHTNTSITYTSSTISLQYRELIHRNSTYNIQILLAHPIPVEVIYISIHTCI